MSLLDLIFQQATPPHCLHLCHGWNRTYVWPDEAYVAQPRLLRINKEMALGQWILSGTFAVQEWKALPVAGGQHQKICVHVLLPGRSIIDHAIWLQLQNRALYQVNVQGYVVVLTVHP